MSLIFPGPVQIVGPDIIVVGDGNQWADGSDATYSQETVPTAGGPTRYAWANLSGTPAPGVVAASLTVRWESLNIPYSYALFVAPAWDSPAWAQVSFTPSGGVQEATMALEPAAGYTITEIFNQSLNLYAWGASGSPGGWVRVLNVAVTAVTDTAPPLQIRQRADGLGVNSAPSLRRPDTQQTTNRLNGTY